MDRKRKKEFNWRKAVGNWVQLIEQAKMFSRATTKGTARFRRERQAFQQMLDTTRLLTGDLEQLKIHFELLEVSADMLLRLVIAMRLWEAQLPDYLILPDEFDAAEEYLESLGMLEKIE